MEKRELVEAAIAGKEVPRVPVSAWGHLIPEETDDIEFAKAQAAYLKEYDWDWLKINNRATLFAEAWGNKFDFSDYSGVLARLESSDIGTPPDITKIRSLDVSSGVLGSYLEKGLRNIIRNIDGVPAVQTVFSPLTVLAFIAGRPAFHSQTEGNRSHAEALKYLIKHQPDEVHAALREITKTLAEFAKSSVQMGTDGIFMAIMLLARDGVLTLDEYEEFGKPYDTEIFNSVIRAKFNILHICGPHSYFSLAQELPANAVSWASVGQGNPTMGEARKLTDKILIGGIDEGTILAHGTAKDIEAEALSTLRESGKYKIFFSPGCCITLDTPKANLHALRNSVEREIHYGN